MRTLTSATLRNLQVIDLDEAAQVVTLSMRDNPVNLRAFGREDAEQRSRSLVRFFRTVLRGLYKRGMIMGAYRDKELVGVCGMAPPGSCQPTLLEKIEVLPSLTSVTPWERPFGSRDGPVNGHDGTQPDHTGIWGRLRSTATFKAKESLGLCCRPSVSEWTKNTRSRTWRPIN